MFQHIFKLVWNRRRSNSLVLVELLLSFLVLCALLGVASNYLNNWRQPLGYDYHQVWNLDIDMGTMNLLAADERKEQAWREYDQFVLLLRDMEEIVAGSPLPTNIPFSQSQLRYRTYIQGEQVPIISCYTTPELMEVLNLELLAGRWLEPGDGELNWRPSVLTRNYAQALFGGV